MFAGILGTFGSWGSKDFRAQLCKPAINLWQTHIAGLKARGSPYTLKPAFTRNHWKLRKGSSGASLLAKPESRLSSQSQQI